MENWRGICEHTICHRTYKSRKMKNLSKLLFKRWKFIAATLILVLYLNHTNRSILIINAKMMKQYTSSKMEMKRHSKERIYGDINAIPLYSNMDEYSKIPPVPEIPIISKKSYSFKQRRSYQILVSNNQTCSSNYVKNSNDSPRITSLGEIFLIIAVKSKCTSSDRRDAIRATWGNTSWIFENLGVEARLSFLLGECENSEDQDNILLEDSKHRDILQWGFCDRYRNLTLKQVLFLQWFASHCRQVPYLFQGDDDVLVNIKNIVQYLKNLPDENGKNLLIGSRLINHSRNTNPRSKYYLSRKLYPKKVYPPYVSGGGYVMSGDLALRCFTQSMKTRLISIEDAFLGIVVHSLGVKPRNDDSFKSWGMNDRSPRNLAHIKTLHRVLPNEMKKLWNAMISYNITD